MSNDIYIGIMSGTSLDSIDLAACSFTPSFNVLATAGINLPVQLRQQILELTTRGDNEIERIAIVEPQLTNLFIEGVEKLLHDNNWHTSQISAIGCHGQTIRHIPQLGFTLQIGDPNRIAERTGITTIADFRRRDMAANGQGAPLVPAFHQQLFQKQGTLRFIVNIGGMANITVLPPQSNQAIQGYDTGPGNVLLDSWIQLNKQQPYDNHGTWAAGGDVNNELLLHLLDENFFSAPPPKSTGRELFNLPWLQQKLLNFPHVSSIDIQATLLKLTSYSISHAIKQHAGWQHSEIYLCGGGAHNRCLFNTLSQELNSAVISTTDQLGLTVDWVEAAAFAWLAYRTKTNQPGNLPSVTGASSERVLGGIFTS